MQLATVGGKATASIPNGIETVVNLQGSTAVLVTSPTSGVTVSAKGKVTIPAGTASPVIIDGITGFENYDVIWKLTTSAATAPTVQLRTTVPSTDATSNYDYQYSAGAATAATAGSSAGTPQAQWPTAIANATRHVVRGTLFAPGLAEATEFLFASVDRTVASGIATISQIDGTYRANTIMAGLSITIPTGTVGGELWVKGLSD